MDKSEQFDLNELKIMLKDSMENIFVPGKYLCVDALPFFVQTNKTL